MTTFQKVIQYLAIAFAVFLTVSIIGGIFSTVGLFGLIFDEKAVTEEVESHTLSSDIRSLSAEVGAADFSIKTGDRFLVESNLKNLSVKEKNGVLIIKDTSKAVVSRTDAMLTLTVPEGAELERVKLTTGAGRLQIESLRANRMDFELGAGEVVIEELFAASEIDIDGGAGKITVSGGELRDLDLSMGVGQLNLTSLLTGECEFDLGVGDSNIRVLGNREDYRLDIEKGIGNITLNGEGISNLKNSGKGIHKIEISGGVGSICLDFEEK